MALPGLAGFPGESAVGWGWTGLSASRAGYRWAGLMGFSHRAQHPSGKPGWVTWEPRDSENETNIQNLAVLDWEQTQPPSLLILCVRASHKVS